MCYFVVLKSPKMSKSRKLYECIFQLITKTMLSCLLLTPANSTFKYYFCLFVSQTTQNHVSQYLHTKTDVLTILHTVHTVYSEQYGTKVQYHRATIMYLRKSLVISYSVLNRDYNNNNDSTLYQFTHTRDLCLCIHTV